MFILINQNPKHYYPSMDIIYHTPAHDENILPLIPKSKKNPRKIIKKFYVFNETAILPNVSYFTELVLYPIPRSIEFVAHVSKIISTDPSTRYLYNSIIDYKQTNRYLYKIGKNPIKYEDKNEQLKDFPVITMLFGI